MDVTLVVTHDCNLGCIYCYAGEKFKRSMPWSVAGAGVRFGIEHTAFGGKMQLSFFGGEPLMEFDLIRRATDLAREKIPDKKIELKLQMTTNGLLLTEKKLDWLADNAFFLGYSIDGNRAAHDATRRFRRDNASSFDRTIENLKRALDKTSRLETIFVVDPANVQYVADGVAFLSEELGVKMISLNPNYAADWTQRGFEIWETQYEKVAAFFEKKFRDGQDIYINWLDAKLIAHLKEGYACGDKCGFGEGEVAIAPTGNMYPCERLVGEDADPNIRIGHVLKGFAGLRNTLLKMRGNENAECAGCEYRGYCMNWCGCVNYAQTGFINRTGEALCRSEKFSIRLALATGQRLFAEGNPLFLRKYYYEDAVNTG